MTRNRTSLLRRIHGQMFKLPLMISCEAFEDFILAYLDGGLPKKQKIVFELHLKVCRECRDYLKAYRASMELVKRAGQAADAIDPPEDIPEDLVKAVKPPGPHNANRPPRHFSATGTSREYLIFNTEPGTNARSANREAPKTVTGSKSDNIAAENRFSLRVRWRSTNGHGAREHTEQTGRGCQFGRRYRSASRRSSGS